MPMPTLPPEIISLILAHVHGFDVSPEKSDKRLARCCRVSKAFLTLARAELYRQLYLHYNSRNLLDGTPFNSPSARILRTLASHPQISALVRSLTVDVTGSEGYYAEAVIQTLLGACTGMVQLSFRLPDSEGRMPESVKGRLLGVASRLVKLVVYGSQWAQDFAQILSEFASLRHLHLYPLAFDTLPSAPSFQLVKFGGSIRARQQNIGTLHHLLSSSHNSLVELYVRTTGILAGKEALDLSPFIALRRLEVYTSCDVHDVRSLARIKAFVKTLPARLDRLGTSYNSGDTAPPDLESLDYLRILPPGLRALALSSTPFSTPYLLKTLSDTSCLSSATEVELDPRLWDVERGRYNRRPLAELYKINKVAEKRGIKAYWLRAVIEEWETTEAVSESDEEEEE
ncbi:hypothetical protein BCR35DRAFT_354469 [Leucosporidium creatinivorum]|uniref:F-box domain-containing protein n=1 Tax=Leucosporidium creatinivorum TaxID=106004 RepID=A0A1Y2EL04_9BASI|nr:hypothetical protein BCR35DRAFT_354469 [Leucosporidium creatinivorum]